MPWKLVFVYCIVVQSGIWASLLNFKPGFEYVYKLNGSVELENVGKFVTRGKIGFTNIKDNVDLIELRMIVHQFKFSPADDEGIIGHALDFREWFSFDMTRHGQILTVYHPAGEDDEVLSTKIGLANMMSAKLHRQDEIEHEKMGKAWHYRTSEVGFEELCTGLTTVREKSFENIQGKGEHVVNQHFHVNRAFLLSGNVLYHLTDKDNHIRY